MNNKTMEQIQVLKDSITHWEENIELLEDHKSLLEKRGDI